MTTIIILYGQKWRQNAVSCSSSPADCVLQEMTFCPYDFFPGAHWVTKWAAAEELYCALLLWLLKQVLYIPLMYIQYVCIYRCMTQHCCMFPFHMALHSRSCQLQLSARGVQTDNSVVCLHASHFPVFPSEDQSHVEEGKHDNLLVMLVLSMLQLCNVVRWNPA